MELKKRRLGRTNLMVTELGLGTYQFTGEFDVAQQEAYKIADYAIESGINFIDTAAMYGFGESEEIVGRALKRHPDKEIFLSTKVGYPDRTVTQNLGDKACQDEEALLRMIKHSMWLLQKDYVDIFMVHEPVLEEWWGFDYETGDSAVLNVLEQLKKEGVIGAIGLGCWNCDVLAELIATDRIDVVLSAGGLSLINQPIREKVLPLAKKHDVGVIAGGVFGQGNPYLIFKKRDEAKELLNSDNEQDRINAKKYLTLYDIADDLGIDMPEMAIRYVLAEDGIHSNVAGAREVAHVKSNIQSTLNGLLPSDIVDIIKSL